MMMMMMMMMMIIIIIIIIIIIVIRLTQISMSGWKMYDLGRHCHRHLGWVVHSGNIINRWLRRWGRSRPEGAHIPVPGSHTHVHSFGMWNSRPYKCKGLCFSYSTWSTPLSLYWRHVRSCFLISTHIINQRFISVIMLFASRAAFVPVALISTPNHF